MNSANRTHGESTQQQTLGNPQQLRACPLSGRSGLPLMPQLSVIVHCHLRWDFVWQRPQQIFSRLAVQHPILFLEDAVDGDGDARLDVTQPMKNVVRVVPVLPGCRYMTLESQCTTVLRLLMRALREHPLLAGKFANPVQWFYSPMTAPSFMGRLNASSLVYDCMDELANFRFAPPDIAQREKFLLSNADVVFTGGYQLYQSKSAHHANTHFYGCGVDVAHFGKASLPETEVPADIASLPHPVFGYFGVVDERLDYALLTHLAESFPDASVVMVGPTAKVDPADLPHLPNIHWLGQRAYDDLPAYVKGFDVCLMPFALNEATQYINPTKTLEYMAAGKPIVSTAVPDVIKNFSPIVKVAYSQQEFAQSVAEALEPSADTLSQGLERAGGASWDAIVAEMRGHILRAVEARTAAVAAYASTDDDDEELSVASSSSARSANTATNGLSASAVSSESGRLGDEA